MSVQLFYHNIVHNVYIYLSSVQIPYVVSFDILTECFSQAELLKQTSRYFWWFISVNYSLHIFILIYPVTVILFSEWNWSNFFSKPNHYQKWKKKKKKCLNEGLNRKTFEKHCCIWHNSIVNCNWKYSTNRLHSHRNSWSPDSSQDHSDCLAH